MRGDASALRAATAERRAAVAALAARAAEVLGDRAPAQAGAVSATLEAATVDEEVAALLRAGRLDKERSAAAAGLGFGDVGDWTPPPPRAAPAKPAEAAAPAKPAEAATPAKPAKPAKAAAPAKPAKPAKAAKSARATAPEPEPEPEPDPAAALRAELDAAVAESSARARDLHAAEEAVRRLKQELADATAALRAARTAANKAELHAEQLRQRVWEAGERRRG